ncbi:unnamed protein product [Withania somnifera]
MEFFKSITNTSSSFFVISILLLFANAASEKIHYHDFVIQATPVRRLCRTHNTITGNGQFPGPTLEVNNGDTLMVNDVNRPQYNVTIYWHGVRQIRTGWADGPEPITQCTIRPGKSYTYRFTIQGQEGTLWWDAHSSWLRPTVYGALIIHPKEGEQYPIWQCLFGEWWDTNPIGVVRRTTRTGAAPNVSDAYTINDTTIVHVDSSEINLLRVINAGLNQQLFFTVANHKFSAVGADANYVKPFTTSVLMLGSGQTTDVLIQADQQPARYYMATRAYASAQGAPFDNTTTTAILEYKTASCSSNCVKTNPIFPPLPAYNDTATATAFTTKFRSARKVAPSVNFQGPNGTRFAASMNNVSFVLISNFSLLQAHHQGIPGVISTDFPAVPPVKFDYTGNLQCGARVQVVLQGTGIFTAENHPIHLQGFDFYIIPEGFGNFSPKRDTAKVNLVDPPLRNTASVPINGWTVIRFVADNPGVWLVHYHLDVHITWGLARGSPWKTESVNWNDWRHL